MLRVFCIMVREAGYIPYVKDVVSILQGYDISRMDMDSVDGLVTAFRQLMNTFGEGERTTVGATFNVVAEAAKVLGVPLSNLKRDVRAVAMTFAIWRDDYLAEYQIERLEFKPAACQEKFYPILWQAYENDRETFEELYSMALEDGMEEKNIRMAMEREMKKKEGVKYVEDLSERFQPPR